MLLVYVVYCVYYTITYYNKVYILHNILHPSTYTVYLTSLYITHYVILYFIFTIYSTVIYRRDVPGIDLSGDSRGACYCHEHTRYALYYNTV